MLVHQNTAEELVVQHDESGSGYNSKSDNGSNKTRCNKVLEGDIGDIGAVSVKHRRPIRRINHLQRVDVQISKKIQDVRRVLNLQIAMSHRWISIPGNQLTSPSRLFTCVMQQ